MTQRQVRALVAGLRQRQLWLASAVAAATLLLALVEIGEFVISGPPGQGSFATMELGEYVLQGSSLVVVGLLLLARRTAVALGWILLGGALPFMAAACLSTWLRYTTHITAATQVAVYLEAALWEVPRVLFALIGLFFPTGKLPGRWARPFAVALVAAILLNEVRTTLGLPQWLPGGVPMANALYWPGSLSVGTLIGPPLELLLLVGVTVAALSSLQGWRRADRVMRRQIAIALPGFLLFLLEEAVRTEFRPNGWYAAAGVVLAAIWPAAIGYVIVRGRLYELDLMARRIVAGAVPVVLLAGVYTVAAVGLSAALPQVGAVLAALVLVLAALVGLVLRPVSRWVAARLDRLMYGERAEPYKIAHALAVRLRDGAGAGDVPEAVCQIVVNALRLPAAALEATTAAEPRRLAEVGAVAAGGLEPFDLRYRGQLVGRLLVAPRARQDRLDELDRSALQSLADLVAPAVSSLSLHEELAQSRAQLLGARQEEQRRLRQDVHDGLGPLLAATRLHLDTAVALLPGGWAGGQLLADASRYLQQVVAEIRQVSDNRPPLAVERGGLTAALVELAGGLRGPALAIEVQQPERLPAMSSTVELAAYRIAAEALTNSVRHAMASRVIVRLTATTQMITVTVADDGTGIRAPGAPGGMGLRSMAERAHRLGGTCEVHSTAEGTTVTARLPASTDPGSRQGLQGVAALAEAAIDDGRPRATVWNGS